MKFKFDDVIKLLKHAHTLKCILVIVIYPLTRSLTYLMCIYMLLAYFLSWQIFIIPSCICMHVHVQQYINIVRHCNGNLFLMSLEDSLYLMGVELILLFIVVYWSERVTIT